MTFWARGERGGERIEFFMGGVGRDAATGVPTMPFPDSTTRRPGPGAVFVLTTQWQQITIDLTGLDLHYVLGGFGWVASAANNPNGAVFYLDDIQYELDPARRAQRLEEPRFLRSFTTRPVQPDPFDANKSDDIDFVLRNTAYTYDNAVALLAFLADGSPDSVRLQFNPYYATTTVSLEPQLTLTLNQTAFHEGDRLILTARVTPGLTPVTADVYLALQPPGCASFACIVFWQGGVDFATTPRPILRNWTISLFDGPIFDYVFGDTEPVGTYAWLGAFVVPGTGILIGGTAEAPFTFNP